MRKPETAALESDTVPRFLFKNAGNAFDCFHSARRRRRMQLGGNSPRLPGRIRSRRADNLRLFKQLIKNAQEVRSSGVLSQI